ncbi:MAG: trehalose/maltose transport system permease protein [Thermoanaerobacteraceae bacterium]|nr:trehalose/maltose transport system permease protein [Thermoanaerobacteraceae bacterium]MDN5301174.1 trehalose/maltose transport system permease protein [Thermoanaerobacteraceae bacterium]
MASNVSKKGKVQELKPSMNISTGKKIIPYILLLPSITIIFIVAFYPIVRTFFFSLYEFNIKFEKVPTKFIGLANYTKILEDPRFVSSLINTIIFVIISVSLELILGILFALIMHKPSKVRGLIRASILMPWAIPTVVMALMWRYMYNDQFGILNHILIKSGVVDHSIVWFGSKLSAMAALIFSDVWKTTPFMALMLLAGLQNIPEELYEAARIDGADNITSFFTITLPLLVPTIIVALLFRTLDAFKVFDLPYILTGGGPGNSTEMITMYTYSNITGYLEYGYGSALSIVIFLIIMMLSFGLIKNFGKSLK